MRRIQTGFHLHNPRVKGDEEPGAFLRPTRGHGQSKWCLFRTSGPAQLGRCWLASLASRIQTGFHLNDPRGKGDAKTRKPPFGLLPNMARAYVVRLSRSVDLQSLAAVGFLLWRGTSRRAFTSTHTIQEEKGARGARFFLLGYCQTWPEHNSAWEKTACVNHLVEPSGSSPQLAVYKSRGPRRLSPECSSKPLLHIYRLF